MDIKSDSMPERTERLFRKIAGFSSHPAFQKMILIGGTAMSIQCGHRLSEDLDFWSPTDTLEDCDIDGLIAALTKAGCATRLATPHRDIVKARINGLDLLNSARDYVIDEVKVTFFHRKDHAYTTFNHAAIDHLGLKIMSLDGIFAMKSYVITQRVKSRDLFDLKYFVQNLGKSFQDILDSAKHAIPAEFSDEEIKSILIGLIPLDKDDEGLYGIHEETAEDVYRFFSSIIDQYEQDACARLT